MIYSKTFRDYNQLPNTLGKGIVQPILKGIGLLTDFNPPVDYYMKHRKEYASLIYFTDGYASLPKARPSGMVWVITSNGDQCQEYPGKTILIPAEDGSNNR